MSSSGLLGRFLSGVLVLCACAGTADADAFDDMEVHGFATQGFVKTSANSFFGDSSDGSFEFRELGVNATLEPSSDIRLSGQLLSRRAGGMSTGSPRVDFALADMSLFGSKDAKLNLLAGRVKNPLGLFNETRDVAFTRPGIFLPQTVYFQSVRSLALSADGAAVRASRFTDEGNFEVQLGFGEPYIDENVEYAYLGDGFRGDFDSDGLSWVGRMMFETTDERWRFALSAASTSLSFDPKSGDRMTKGTIDILYAVASAQYAAEEWTISAEYVVEPIDYNGFEGTPFHGQSPTLEGYYAQINWRAESDVELMVRYEEGFIDKSDKDGRAFAAATGLPAHARYLKALSFGARWDLNENIAMRAEYQRNVGTLILSNKENPRPELTQGNWDMFSLSASYRF